ncbi:hypothetical protein FE257_010829 [Aspergillus nanangensis]|uniref:Uncharacterized protein n=1 Tax=Aspergillus nanangensis TaxID=2582783 RepID=A0AAD4GY13_ASPNN|nr:hypothetical protein FE257_010829 [Aspergillus nanangensis]
MAPKPLTNDWDILVSYATGDDLNNLLKNSWAGLLGTSEIEHSDEDFGYKAKLEKPSLEITGNDLKATLHVDLTGTFWSNDWSDDGDGDKPTYKFEDYEYRLSITAPIGSIDGDQTMHSGDNVITFDQKSTDAHQIVLHMQNQKLKWKSVDADPGNKKAKIGKALAAMAVGKVEDYVRSPNNIRWLDIKLGEVNNVENKETKSDLKALFQPKSFKLATRPGALDIFIQTVSAQGLASPSFDVKNSAFDTSDYNGAIILSHRLFQDLYLVPQIQKHCTKLAKDGDKHGRVTANKVDSGFQLELVFDKKETLSERGATFGFGYNSSAQEITLDFANYPVKLNIVNNEKKMPHATWEWNYDFTVHWKDTIYNYDMPDRVVYDSSTINAKIGDNKSDIATLEDNNLDFNFAFKTEFQPKMTIPDKTTDKYKNIHVTFDVFKFGLDELQYFASTNVFAPGQHFIDLKTVRAPHDLFVMGKMKPS